MKPVIVGISGASGSRMAKATVDALLECRIPITLVCTNDAKLVWQQEMDESFNQCLSSWREDPHFRSYGIHEMNAVIASGSYPTSGMVIVPCSMASVASIAQGIANNLLLRAADVCLKERRTLVVVPRETPIHSIHLKNLTTLARLGAVILPPEPPFYLRVETVADIVKFFVMRILVLLGLEDSLPYQYQYRGPDQKQRHVGLGNG